MIVKQIDQTRIETTEVNGKYTTKRYYPIDSKQGQELIKEHKIIIDPEMEEF